jgi:hypothetical protein
MLDSQYTPFTTRIEHIERGLSTDGLTGIDYDIILEFELSLTLLDKTGLYGNECLPLINTFSCHI